MQKCLYGKCTQDARHCQRLYSVNPDDKADVLVHTVGSVALLTSKIANVLCRFFTFHAVLIPSVCLCVDPTSADAPAWKVDIDATKDLLLFAFPDNPLAHRCLEILNRLVPQEVAAADNSNAYAPLGIDGNPEDLQAWLMDPADPMNMFGWTDLGQDIGQDLWQYN